MTMTQAGPLADCSRFVELARRMSIPSDDAIRQCIGLGLQRAVTEAHR